MKASYKKVISIYVFPYLRIDLDYSSNIVLELKSIYDADIYKKSRDVI